MKNEKIKLSEREIKDLTQPPEKRKYDTYNTYLLLKRLEEVSKKDFLEEELGAVLKNYKETAEREMQLPVSKETAAQRAELELAKLGLAEWIQLLRAGLICQGIDNPAEQKLLGGQEEERILYKAAQILSEHCFKVLEGKLPEEVDSTEVRNYLIDQIDKYIKFLESLLGGIYDEKERRTIKEIEGKMTELKEACIRGERDYHLPPGLSEGDDDDDDNAGEEWKWRRYT